MSNAVSNSSLKIVVENRGSSRVSKDGYSFDIYSNKWHLNKDVTISFKEEVLGLEADTLAGFRLSLGRYAEECSAKHTSNMYHRLQRMVRDTGCVSIDVNVIRNWRASLDVENEWYLGALRGFLISWYDYGYKGVGSAVVKVLEGMRLSGNAKGVAIANRCEFTGAFTQNEQIAVANELIRLFDEDLISLPCYSYLLTLQATARRPVQIRQLKIKDLIKESCPKTKAVNFYLNIPRSKQRGTGFREIFKRLAITEDLYLTLVNLAEHQHSYISLALNIQLNQEEKYEVPLFLDYEYVKRLKDTTQTDSLIGLLKSDVLHMSSNQLRQDYMQKVSRLNQAVSERTGDIILLSARRFKRTRGTNLGRKGVSVYVIAEALDHSDTQNVEVYTENTADTVTYIDKAIGKQLAPIAKAFKGVIIEDIQDGERGADPTARIPNKDNDVVGACGTNDFCIKGYEACYLCEKFRPLLDAPHEKFLDSLYAEKESRLKATGSEQYASTKDTLILAVEWVVQSCNELKQQGEDLNV